MDKEAIVAEFFFRTSRSGGKGGQHVNKVETKVEAVLCIPDSEVLTDWQKQKLLKHYETRISAEGHLSTVDQSSRSQATNRDRSVEKLFELIEKGLVVEPPRKIPKIPRSVLRARLETKRRRSEVKANRRKLF